MHKKQDNGMNEKTIRVLEFDRILNMLADAAAAPPTKQRALALTPAISARDIREMQAETTEAVSVLVQLGSPGFGAFYDVAGVANLASKAGVLTQKQLLEILYNLQMARQIKKFLSQEGVDGRRILGLAEVLTPLPELANEIDRCIISEEEIADSASPELKRIRRSIGLQSEQLRSRMNSILNAADNRSILQDAVVTLRQERYVIPVKAEHRARVPGIIHDQSASGSTLFVEPQAIVDMNNALRELELAEKQEIYRILAELSAQVGDQADVIVNNLRILTDLDFIFAKGRLSVNMRGSEAVISDGRSLILKNARHPLIDRNKVVPISLTLGQEHNTLIITGPNTGGKTVTLKTTGLLALMAQSGLHIPADSGSTIPVFQKIYADIGDEQSIEQSLSTFSSHMANIVGIVKEAGQDTLVLLDELGAGTDPTEGAALAIAILSDLFNKGALTLATTHYAELKKFALATPGVQNAAMAFDVETLSPTYRLTLGTPGKSNAFAIAEKLGLPVELVEKAGSLLEQDDIQFEDVLAAVHEDRRRAEEELDEAMAIRLEMKKQEETLAKERRRFAEKKDKLLEEARAEARETLREAREFADEMRQELKALEHETDAGERERRQEVVRRKIRDRQSRYREKTEPKINPKPLRPAELKPGDWVRVLTLDQTGQVLNPPDDKNEVQVQVGSLRISVAVNRLARADQPGDGGVDAGLKKGWRGRVAAGQAADRREKTPGAAGDGFYAKAASVTSSINVIGKNLDDARMDVDKYLDDAFLAGLAEVSVIHGRGAGILREGLTAMFKRHKHVAGFRRGSYNEGGDGVTIVQLKKK